MIISYMRAASRKAAVRSARRFFGADSHTLSDMLKGDMAKPVRQGNEPGEHLHEEVPPVFRRRHHNFIDKITFLAKAGDGGTGGIFWYRFKNNPFAGPAGGHGGDGGHVRGQCTDRYHCLAHLIKGAYITFDPENPDEPVGVCTAGMGINGDRSGMGGNFGHPILLPLPLGTVIVDADTNRELVELTRVGELFTFAEGGKGGKGNQNLSNPVMTSPDFAEMGHSGESKLYTLELRSIADIAMIGPPNSGKSSLLGTMSRGAPEPSDKPFSSWKPSVGKVMADESFHYSMVDLPPLTKGAHRSETHRTGNEFLRHAIRANSLIYVVDSTSAIPLHEVIANMQEELEYYEEGLSHKAIAVAVTKMDIVVDERSRTPTWDRVTDLQQRINLPVFPVSAHTKKGVLDFALYLAKMNRGFVTQKEADEAERTRSMKEDVNALEQMRLAETKQIILQRVQDFHMGRAVEDVLEERIRGRPNTNEAGRSRIELAKDMVYENEYNGHEEGGGSTVKITEVEEGVGEPFVMMDEVNDSEVQPEDWAVGGMEDLASDRRTKIYKSTDMWSNLALGTDEIEEQKRLELRKDAEAASIAGASLTEISRPEYIRDRFKGIDATPDDTEMARRHFERAAEKLESVQTRKLFQPKIYDNIAVHKDEPVYSPPELLSPGQKALKEVLADGDRKTGFAKPTPMDYDFKTHNVDQEFLDTMRDSAEQLFEPREAASPLVKPKNE
eukprot:TRINITY_DN3608_c0_g1_i1.p1 TRINITY_DN3608_c0_g1~~TRINITY_DN3608_c0_g1_i1.p1  ORF type:complete len:776 (+),score=243.36 TRINITY_DN3608_c0_g1_i1:153-2330(+)